MTSRTQNNRGHGMGRHQEQKTSRRDRRRAQANRPLPPAIEPVSLLGAHPVFDDPAQMTAQDLRCQSPVRPYLPELPTRPRFVPNPLTDPDQPITADAVIVRDMPRRWVLRLPCGGPGPDKTGCPKSHGYDQARSFTDVYGRAAAAGWQQDVFGDWTCPDCQMLPTWRTPHAVRPRSRTFPAFSPQTVGIAEQALAEDVGRESGDWASLVELVIDAGDATGVTPQPRPAVAA